MRKSLSIGTLVLSCCLGAAAQMGSTPNQIPPASTPPTFPQEQTGQSPTNPSAMPPDTSAPPTADRSSQASNSQTSVQGCLSRGSNGFVLADNSGTSYQLRGDSSQLGDFVGTMVAVDGTITSSDSAGAMASQPSSNSLDSAGRQLSVSHIRKISASCATSSPATK